MFFGKILPPTLSFRPRVFYQMMKKKVDDSMQNVFAHLGFVFYCQIHYFAIDAQKNLGGGLKSPPPIELA